MKLKAKYFWAFGPEHNIINIHFIQLLYICTLKALAMAGDIKENLDKQCRRGKRIKSKSCTNKSVGMISTLQDFSTQTSIHGMYYVDSNKHSRLGRILWMLMVVLALACTTYQVVSIWYQWSDDPVVTSLKTISLPVEQIDFPAVTICPQGSTAIQK